MSLITNAPVTWLPLWQYSFHFLLAKHFQPSLTIAYLQSLLPIIQIDIPWHWPWEYKSGQHTLDFWSQAGPALLHGHQQPVACCNRWTDPSHYFGHSTPVTSTVASTSTVALLLFCRLPHCFTTTCISMVESMLFTLLFKSTTASIFHFHLSPSGPHHEFKIQFWV